MFDISFFRNNPLPFYTLAHELYPGKHRPTVSHSFIRLLSDKGLLLKLFTQNIDCLDREAGVPEDKVVEAHGSFATHHCIECKSSYPENLMKETVRKCDVPHCLTPQCNGLVKPDIVFFGEPLPENFHRNRALPGAADLCIVMGTSLSVQPFASLPGFCSEGVPRLLINSERVGGLGSRADDVLLLEDCDSGVRKLAAALGWEEELEVLWQETRPEAERNGDSSEKVQKSKDEKLNDQIERLTKEVDESLKITDEHTTLLREHLAEKQVKGDDAEESASTANIVPEGAVTAETSSVTDKESAKTTTDSEREQVLRPKVTPQSSSEDEMKAPSESTRDVNPASSPLTDTKKSSL